MTETVSPTHGTGPLYGFALNFEGIENAVDPADADAVRIEGRVLKASGRPIVFPEAFMEFFGEDQFARGRVDEAGDWHVTVRKPSPRRHDGGETQAPHFAITFFVHPILEPFRTRMYFPDEEAQNAEDPVLGLIDPDKRDRLVAKPAGPGVLRFDVHLSGSEETPFLDFVD